MIESKLTNPETRFTQTGAYDEGAYDRDLLEFPEYFDRNGWPLFGNVDPYALIHPFTGRPWFEAPRIPTKDEGMPDYSTWFGLALDFCQALEDIAEQQRQIPEKVLPHTPLNDEALYKAESKFAVLGNIIYLQNHILPKLTSLLSARVQPVLFALLWGQCKEIIGALPISVTRARLRQEGVLGAQVKAKDAQLKWYIHFRD